MLFDAPRPVSREPWASSQSVRRTMQGNRRRDTAPEIAVRRLLHAAGMRYRVDVQPLPELRRRADVVFRRQRVAVFIDGCYWHGCPEHGTTPRTNPEYWSAKVAANRARDADTDVRLSDAGWLAARYWEHVSPEDVAAEIIEEVRRRQTDHPLGA